jgi:membrane protein YdbS with pleckstrin-like domain
MVSAAGLAEGEYSVLKLRQHWKTVLRPVLILAATVIVLLVLLIAVPSIRDAALARLALALLALAVVLVFVAVPLLRWWSTSYELTNRRLRLRTGVVTRTGRDFPLSKISDVSFAQGPLDRLLRCGRLVVESPGERGQLVLTEIPRVQEVQATLFQLVEDEQARLGRDQRYPPLS